MTLESDGRARRLSALQRSRRGESRRAALVNLLSSREPEGPGQWDVLPPPAADELRASLLAAFHGAAGGSPQQMDAEALESSVRMHLRTHVSPDRTMIVHFQDSAELGLLVCRPEFLQWVALDLLKFDGNGVVAVRDDFQSGFLLDRTVRGDREELEFLGW